MRNTVELKNEKRTLVDSSRKLLNKVRSESRDLTPAEQKQLDDIISQIDAISDRIAALENIDVGPDAARGLWSHASSNKYSIMRAIRSYLNGGKLDGIEAEVSQELESRMGKSPTRGFFVPFESRALNTTTGSGGVGTNTLPTYVELLRNKLLADRLGATFLNNLNGIVRLPRQTGSATVSWIAEGTAVSASNQTVDYVQLTPKTLAANTIYTRKFLNESPINVERFVTEDLAAVVAREIDRVLVNGSGSGQEPTGILNAGSLPTVSIGTNGGALTWEKVVELETTVLTANGVQDETNCRYLTSPRGLKSAKTVSKGSSYPLFLYDDASKTLNSYEAVQSNVVPIDLEKGTGADLSAMIFGDWTQAVIGSWGSGYELCVDPYSRADYGEVRLVALHDVDIAFRHLESFAAIKDMS